MRITCQHDIWATKPQCVAYKPPCVEPMRSPQTHPHMWPTNPMGGPQTRYMAHKPHVWPTNPMCGPRTLTDLAETRGCRCSGRGGFGGGSSLLVPVTLSLLVPVTLSLLVPVTLPLSLTSSLNLEMLFAGKTLVSFRISFSRGVSGMSGREDRWGLEIKQQGYNIYTLGASQNATTGQ